MEWVKGSCGSPTQFCSAGWSGWSGGSSDWVGWKLIRVHQATTLPTGGERCRAGTQTEQRTRRGP